MSLHSTGELAEQGAFTFFRIDNHGFEAEEGCRIKKLVVWGGVVANCGEAGLSKLVDKNAPELRSATYCPDRTKGGALVRPKYHEGDRGGRAVFPQLTDLTIRLEPALLPEDYGWITPGLRRLRLMCVVSRNDDWAHWGRRHQCLPSRQALRAWLGTDEHPTKPKSLRQRLLLRCPELESITIAVGSTVDDDYTGTDWITMSPPAPVPWDVHRLLLLPLTKPACGVGSVINGVVHGSPLSSLTQSLVHLICEFLGSPSWRYHDINIPMSVGHRLGLQAAFCSKASADILQDSSATWTLETEGA